MRHLSWAAVLLIPAANASAAGLGPTAQTLEAIHGTAVNDPARFFDGLESHVALLEPTDYAPLPPAPLKAPAETRFDAHAVAPGLTVHTPIEATAAPADETASKSGPSTFLIILAVAASVAIAAALLLIFL